MLFYENSVSLFHCSFRKQINSFKQSICLARIYFPKRRLLETVISILRRGNILYTRGNLDNISYPDNIWNVYKWLGYRLSPVSCNPIRLLNWRGNEKNSIYNNPVRRNECYLSFRNRIAVETGWFKECVTKINGIK